MANINQLSQLGSLQNVSHETSKATKTNGEDFLALLKDIQARNTADKSSQTSIASPNFSGNIFKGSNASPYIGGTEAFLNMQNVKNTNPIYNAIDTVNAVQIKADKSAAAFAAGYGDELDVVLDVSKAEKYLQFFSEVRVKFINAIKELSRTQI